MGKGAFPEDFPVAVFVPIAAKEPVSGVEVGNAPDGYSHKLTGIFMTY